jgi:sodium-dependent dicarboxylate transporter 2/3/5
MTASTDGIRPRVGLLLGPLLLVIMLLAPAPEGMTPAAWRTAAVGVLMATWWIAEPVPIAVTALLPLVLFPLLEVATLNATAAPYANPVIFLFLGGFLMALALERTGLHRRAALATLAVVGTRPAPLVFGFMAVTAFISMWVSNTATTVMILPMALAVMSLATGDDRERHDGGFGTALLLGIAYAATIGGLGTLIGTPPNALFAAFMAESYGIRIGFAEWMLVAVPVVLVALPITWWILTHVIHRLDDQPIAGGAALLADERLALGPVSRDEWFTGGVTVVTAAAWICRPLLERLFPAISDTGIAIAAVVVLFAVPMGWRPLRQVVTWQQADRLPWGVLLLFGGGLSLAAGIQGSGLAEWIGLRLGGVTSWPAPAMVLVLVATVIVLSEFASNTAIAAAFLPIVATLAVGDGNVPVIPVLATAMAASGGFMLPVSTPPNAIVYGTGRITVGQMAVSGGLVDLLFVAILPVAVLLLGARVFG